MSRSRSDSILVRAAAILRAQRRLWDVARIVVEPGGAAGAAALTSGRYRPRSDERVAVLLRGGEQLRGEFRTVIALPVTGVIFQATTVGRASPEWDLRARLISVGDRS